MGNDVGVVDRTRRRSVTRPTSVVPRLPCSWTAASSERAPDGCDAHAYSCAAPCPSMPAMPPWRVPGCSRKPACGHTEPGRHARDGLAMDSGGPHACPTCMHRMYAPHACTGRMHAMDSVARSSPWQCLSACHPGPHGRTRGRRASQLRTATSPSPAWNAFRTDTHAELTARCHTRHFHVHVSMHMEMCRLPLGIGHTVIL